MERAFGLAGHGQAEGWFRGPASTAPASDTGGGPGRPGGAELVQLRREVRGAAKVQSQSPQEPDEEGRLPVERQLMEAVSVVRGEDFPARAGSHCDHCSFHAICPVKGAGTVLS